MKVLVAPSRASGGLAAADVATTIAMGWRGVRPDDDLVLMPLSDGSVDLLDTVVGPDDTWLTREVAGPFGHPVSAPLLLRPDATAVVDAALACGRQLATDHAEVPARATTYGVGQLLDAARDAGARRVLLGLGGAAAVDGGAGALLGLGFRLMVDDGGGLKIGGDELHRVTRASRGWAGEWAGTEVVLLAARPEPLTAASALSSGGLDGPVAAARAEALGRWADVAERDLAGGATRRDEPGTGDGGGLGFGLRCGLPTARVAWGPEVVADLLGLDEALADVDLVITNGDPISPSIGPSVLASVLDRGRAASIPVVAIVHPAADGTDEAAPMRLPGVDIEVAGDRSRDPGLAVGAAARRAALARSEPA